MNKEELIKKFKAKIEANSKELEKEIENLMNKYNIDTITDTPDFIIAEYLMTCLRNYLVTKNKVEKWFGKRITINGVEELKENKQ